MRWSCLTVSLAGVLSRMKTQKLRLRFKKKRRRFLSRLRFKHSFMALFGVAGCSSRLYVCSTGTYRARVGGVSSSKMVNDDATRHKREGTTEGYREAVIRTGWTSGPGLFETDDPVLFGKYASDAFRPFAKHLPNAVSPYEPVETGGFISGREAVEQRGIDLRLLWECEGGKVVGVVRFDGGKAAIGPGYSVHGGAIQAVLDEATAEAGKMGAFPYLATRRISHEIKKPVPCGTTLEVWTEVREVKGLRCFVAGEIRDPTAGTVFASAEAELVNMVPFLDRE